MRESIFTVPAAGGEVKRLTTGDHDVDPVWSPDGTQLALERSPIVAEGTDERRVWVMDADGANARDHRPLRALRAGLAARRALRTHTPDDAELFPEAMPAPDPPRPRFDPPVTRPVTPRVTVSGRLSRVVLNPSRFTWRTRSTTILGFSLSRPAPVTLTVKRFGRTAAVRTVVLDQPAPARVPIAVRSAGR